MKKILTKKIDEIVNLHLVAFGEEEGVEVSDLAKELLLLENSISISFEEDEKIIGNVIFTPFKMEEHPEKKYYLLAPLGILPSYQKKGLGRSLIESGVEHLKELDVDGIFVLGIPEYYPKIGFKITEITSPYSDVMVTPDSWMALEIKKGSLKDIKGQGVGVAPIMKKELWDTRKYLA